MPLFAVPSLPSLPSFPSISSMRSFLDPEPQLFYPAPKSPSRRRPRRDSGSSTRSTSSGFGQNGNNRTDGIVSDSPLRRAPVASRSGLGRMGGASRSAVDLTGWAEVENPIAELGRRHSISLQAGPIKTHKVGSGYGETPPTQKLDSTSLIPSPSRRPSHRRSQSALPSPGYIRHPPPPPLAPRNRLTEYSRNSLASSSAISLPTLAEADSEPPQGTNLYRRPSTRTTITIPSCPSSPTSPGSTSSFLGSLPSPLGLNFSISSQSSSSSCESDDYFGNSHTIVVKEDEDLEETDNEDTPKPKRRTQGLMLTLSPPSSSSVPPPLRVARLRPPSFLQPTQSGMVRSKSSIGAIHHGRSPSMALGTTTTVSDVAVMATWAFPSSPERSDHIGLEKQEEARISIEKAGKGSGRLRERLRTLSMLDTSSPSITDLESPSRSPIQQPFKFPHPPLARSAKHRHTNSSPYSLPPPRPSHTDSQIRGRVPFPQSSQMSQGRVPFPTSSPSRSASVSSFRDLSPNRPGHRRTTTPSRLRSPQLLSLPLITQDSDRSSDIRHPLSRTRSAIEPPMQDIGQKGGSWWRTRRNSMSGAISPKKNGGEGEQTKDGMREVMNNEAGVGERRERGNAPEDERFIDFDDM